MCSFDIYHIKRFFRYIEIDKKLHIALNTFNDTASSNFRDFLNQTDYMSEVKHMCKKMGASADGSSSTTALLDLFKSQHKPSYYKFYVYATTPENNIDSIKFALQFCDKPRNELMNELGHFMIHDRILNMDTTLEVEDMIAKTFTSCFLDSLGCFLYSLKQKYRNNFASQTVVMLNEYRSTEAIRYIPDLVYRGENFNKEKILETIGIGEISESLEKYLVGIYHKIKKLRSQLVLDSDESYQELCKTNPLFATKFGGYNNVKYAGARIKKLLSNCIFQYLDMCAPKEETSYYDIVNHLKLPEIENVEMTAVCIEI